MIMTIAVVLREATATARSSTVTSLVTLLMVAGTLIAVLLTTGRSVSAEQSVLASIDQVGTRSITIRAELAAGVDAPVIERIRQIRGITWAGALSEAKDATNAFVPGSTRVPVRQLYADDLAPFGIPDSPREGHAYASAQALDLLGMPDGSGAATRQRDDTLIVAGTLSTPEFLAAFEPLILIPSRPSRDEAVSVIVVVAESPELVAPVSAAVLSVLAATDPTKVSVTTSEGLAQLRSLIEGKLSSYSRDLVLVLLGLTGVLLTAVLFGFVLLRRKDFGRRRALGATRGFIVNLMLVQTALLGVVGAALGVGVSTLALTISGDRLPGLPFMSAISVLTVLTAVVATVVPAIVASRREPIRELRVP